ncbi:hypothetical protein ACLMJK_007564 [Lecanora helva]
MSEGNQGSLFIKDSRTSRKYEIPIHRNGVRATAFKRIKAPGTSQNTADKTADGLRVFDPGLQNTAVVETSTSFADSDRGQLFYRGHNLTQLWTCDFEAMLHLMVWNEYPTEQQIESLRFSLATAMMEVPKSVVDTIRSFPPPVPMVLAGLAAYMGYNPASIPAFNGGNIYHGNAKIIDKGIISTVAAYAVAVGLAASHRKGIKYTPASTQNTYYENLFVMMGIVNPSSGRPDPLHLSYFRRFAVLNADHSMTLSTFVMLATASSLPDPVSCLMSAIAAAYGPLHFGAPEAACRTLQRIGSLDNVPSFIEEVKRGERRLFGFGHRTYKVVDPRLGPIKHLLAELDAAKDSLFKVAQEIERVASGDEYFRTRRLNANADFYGHFVFTSM